MTQDGFRLLHQLPEELLQEILCRLDSPALSRLALASHWTYVKAAAWIWREVNLVDGKSSHIVWDGYDKDVPADNDDDDDNNNIEDGVRGRETSKHITSRYDEHDDTAIIRKLIVLASKPWIAESVQTLTHRCHLPPPAIFNELPHAPFASQTLSADPRTTRLAYLACQNMRRLHTLRIIFGHPSLNDAILRSLFDKARPRNTPIRRLWLENCRLNAGCESFADAHPFGLDVLLELDFAGLESLRLRRMPLRPGLSTTVAFPAYTNVYARSQNWRTLQDGAGGMYVTTMNSLRIDQISHDSGVELGLAALMSQYALGMQFDDKIYDKLMENLDSGQREMVLSHHISAHEERCWKEYRGPYLDPLNLKSVLHDKEQTDRKWNQRETSPSVNVAINMLQNTSETLTSLCLDWVFTSPNVLGSSREPGAPREWFRAFARLFSLRFPQLRAFQLRNATVPETMIPPGLFLLDRSRVTVHNKLPDIPVADYALDHEEKEHLDLACLEFMEAHCNLHCLAWPIHAFFTEHGPAVDISSRVENVIEALGRSLVDLRVDAHFSGYGEALTEEVESRDFAARDRRRKFIELFASKMTKVESIKIEGGLPRDEQREIMRALHKCPVKKLVIIGVSSPIGNTWGLAGQDLPEPLDSHVLVALEAEDKAAIHALAFAELDKTGPDSKFSATYGWPSGPPQMHNVASLFSHSITELKFCGHKGAPFLFDPTPITVAMLYPLKHFHNLENLVLSVWLNTHFEGEPRDHEIIDYWMDARTPTSTALVHITDDEPQGWERQLWTKFSPHALAWRVTSFIGMYLSDEAKQRPGGVNVRATFCLGHWGGIFDIDVRVGYSALGSKLLGYNGPREELEPQRRREKLESRRWF